MSSEWPVLRIDKIGLVKSGKRLPLGDVLSEEKTPFPYIRLVDVSDGVIQRSSLKFLKKETRERIRRYVVNSGDVCLAIVGHTIGMVFFVNREWDDVNLTENAARITELHESVNSKYLYYYLISPAGQAAIKSRIIGSAQGKLPLYNIKSLDFPVPPRSTQDLIVGVLDSINLKISNLREVNTTLEAISQSLFKSWFVDFDPVRAKREGRLPDGMDETMAALFPDDFEESELGLVPRGWRAAKLGSVSSYLSRGISPKYLESGGVLVINQKCIRDFSVDYSKARRHDPVQRKIDGRPIALGDVLVNSTGIGTLGRVAQVLELPEPTIVDSHVTVVRAGEQLSWTYLGQVMMRKQPEIEAMGEGSTGQTELSRSKLADITVLVPPRPILALFDQVVIPLKDRIAVNENSTRTLEKLRDTLLPRLISGQLLWPETEQFTEAMIGT
jgi:type I restriction enzyme S subunit